MHRCVGLFIGLTAVSVFAQSTATPELTPPPLKVESAPAEAAPVEPRGPSLADRTAPKAGKAAPPRGGPLFAFVETIDGLVVGGLIGAGLTSTGSGSSGSVYLGAITGGLVMGTIGFAIQYFHPIGLASAATISLGLGVGALFGAGIASATLTGLTGLGFLMLAGSQLGMALPLALLWSSPDMNGEDVALIGMCAVYGFVLAALVSMIATPTGPPAWALLTAPAVGMGLGGLWAWATDMAPGRVLRLTALPLGVGALLLFLGSQLATVQTTGITTLLGVLATFGLTYIFTMEETPAQKTAAVTMRPSLALVAPARRHDGFAAGPAVVFSF